MEDYKKMCKPNSHKYKEMVKQEEDANRPKLEKVITGTAKVRKKSPARKFADVFISEDVENVKTYILSDVIVPAIKNLIANTIKDGIDMCLYGGVNRRDGRSRSGADYVSYNRFSDRDRRDRYDDRDRTRRGSSFDCENITVPTRGEAERVLDALDDIIAEYKVARVGDLYDIVDLTAPHTANKYGWTNLRNAKVVRVGSEYGFILPKAMPLD